MNATTHRTHNSTRWLLHLALAGGSALAAASQPVHAEDSPGTSVLIGAARPAPAAEVVAEVPPGSAPTDRAVVFRRLCIDILGRLPTPEETQDFLKDTSPQAYGRAVDRLMARQLEEQKPSGSNKVSPPPTAASQVFRAQRALAAEEQARAAEAVAKSAAAKLRDAETANKYRQAVNSYYWAAGQGTPPQPVATAMRAVFAPKMLKTSYLGVGVETPGETLRAQLSLPDGAGLVVNHVDDSGPSKKAIHLHDVLQKLDDQILVNGEQFVALVRMHRAGDTVKVTLIRAAKQVTVDVKLGEHEVQVGQAESLDMNVNQLYWTVDAPAAANAFVSYPVTPPPASSEARAMAISPDGNTFAARTAHAGPIQIDDGAYTIVLPPDKVTELKLFDSKTGKIIYSGPMISSEEDPHASLVPPDARKKIILWHKVLGERGKAADVDWQVESAGPMLRIMPATQPAPLGVKDPAPSGKSAKDEEEPQKK